jgi:hypothetical protein
MIKELDYPAYANAARFQRISWGAVSAGAVTTLAVLSAMTALGAGFGLVSGPTLRGLSWSFGTGSAVWMLLSGVIASYAGGWIAGRLTGIALVSESVIHGIAAWGAASLALAAVFNPTMIGGHAWTSAYDSLTAATLAGELGVMGRFAFLMLACNAVASAYGAREGTRVLRPVPMSAPRREHAGV